jgi:acetyl-CoA C-acetyltransferase
VSLDPRTPVIVGAGQVCHRDGAAPEPVRLLAEAAHRAEEDSHSPGLLRRLDSIRVVHILSWRYRDPGRLLAELVGAVPRHTAVTTVGGQSPQALLARTAADIQAGRADLVLVGGAETWRTRRAIRATGERPPWADQPAAVEATEVIGGELVMGTAEEVEVGLTLPSTVYPIFENALRAAAGRGLAEHTRMIAGLWARFSDVAAGNPHAALRRRFTAEEIATPGRGNRMVGFPYTKLMNSNSHVDQAAAILLASAGTAAGLGVPSDRWVFPVSAASASDTPAISERADLHSSPALRCAGREALRLAGVEAGDLAHVDLYSCFPSAVGVAAAELGLPLDRELTVTGGLTFAGGPWSDYVSHAVATMVGRLRQDPGAVGLCTANGGYLSKHAVGVYSTRPPERGFRHADVQEEVDRLPRRQAAHGAEGAVVIESYTVVHDRAGAPERAVAACLLPDGRRTWGVSTDPDVLGAMLSEELCGRAAKVEDRRLVV